MKTVTIKYTITILLLFFIPSLNSCAKEKSEEPLKISSSADALMESLNIQKVARPVKAPDFKLLSVNGKKVSLSQYRGKIVLLSFWATW
jgi:cytochrome oxidase Cu insertion factor (SCO1/SenC/PrrC family)